MKDIFFEFINWLANININDFEVIYILWNFILLLIPYYICLFLFWYKIKTDLKKIYQKIIALGVSLIWLLFIPNTVYLVADVRHLATLCQLSTINQVCVQSAWLIFFFFAYGAVGWVAMVYLLRQMKGYIRQTAGKKIVVLFDFLMPPLLSMGILLGLVQRWNSWDFLKYPSAIFQDAGNYFLNPLYLKNWLIVTIIIYILYWSGNYLFKDKFKN